MTAVALSALTGFLLVGCSAGSDSAPDDSLSAPHSQVSIAASLPPGASPYAIPTGTYVAGDPSASAMAADITGPLTLTPGGCLVLGDTAWGESLVVWPSGFTAARWSNGRVVVLDEHGRELAELGDRLSMGGGGTTLGITDQRCLDVGMVFEAQTPPRKVASPPPSPTD